MRLDLYILSLYPQLSRNKIQNLIKNNLVKINNKIISKPSFEIENNINLNIEIIEKIENIRVSRAGYKLDGWFNETRFNIKNLIVLDIGASTGGFTEVLLEKGVSKVYALDVGTLQLDQKLKNDPRVVSIENMDIRNFYSEKFDFITCDVSFISLSNILKDIDRLANKYILFLFKPQFEVGKNIKRDSYGVVKDYNIIYKRIEEFKNECLNLGWNQISFLPSKLYGKDGNREFFLFFTISDFGKIPSIND